MSEIASPTDVRASTLKGRYFPAIDGIRAIAVLSVVLFHIDHRLLPGGFAGVDVFFVISGFVVALATGSLDTSRFFGLTATFIRRRILRIFPALLVCVAITQLLSVLFIPSLPSRSWDGDWTGLFSILALSNVELWQRAAGYFSAGPDFNPFTHTWSLGVEEQFYVIFPLLGYWFLFHQGSLRRIRAGMAIVLGLSAASLIAAAFTPETFAFYMVFTRFWELGAGVLLCIALDRGQFRPVPPGGSARTGWVAVAGTALLAAGLIVSDPLHFPWPFAVLPVTGTVLLLAAVATDRAGLIGKWLSSPAARHFGQISYSLYLWHWPVVVLLRWTTGLDSPLQKIAAWFLSWLLGYASYRLIERPIRRSGHLAKRPNWQILLGGAGATGVAAAAILGMVMLRPVLSLSVTRDRDVWAMVQPSQGPDGCTVRAEAAVGGLLFRPVPCGKPAIGRTLFIVGDSHAMAYQRLSSTLARQTGIQVYNWGETGCATLPRPHPTPAPETANCPQFLAERIASSALLAKRGDWLFLPGMRMPHYRGNWDIFPHPEKMDQEYDETGLKAFALTVKPLLDRGVRVIIEAPKPVYSIPAMRCADWFNRSAATCRAAPISAAELHRNAAPVERAFARIRAMDPRIEVWNPFGILCPGPTCTPFLNGRPVSYDGDHMTGAAQDLLTPDFERILFESR